MALEKVGIQSLPGQTPQVDMTTVDFLRDNNHFRTEGVRIHKDTVDSRSTLTFKLQGGLILVRVETGANKNMYVATDHADAPLAAAVKDAVILLESFSMKDRDGVVEDKTASGVVHGFVTDAKLNFTTVDATYIANIKAILTQVRFFLPAP